MTERQQRLLDAEDGRHHAVSKVHTGLGMVATSERVAGRIVAFSLPSGPGLFLNLAHRAYVQLKEIAPASLFQVHPQGVWPEPHGPLFDYFETFIAHVVFSFTALEAFANESLPDDITYEHVTKKTGVTKQLGRAEIERALNLDDKLHTLLPTVAKLPSPKGLAVWSRYRRLRAIRDRVIHLKTADRKPLGPDVESIWGDMLRMHGVAFCNHAHEMMGYFQPLVNRRWFKKYPYSAPSSDDHPPRSGSRRGK
jgi:hypothetical protein